MTYIPYVVTCSIGTRGGSSSNVSSWCSYVCQRYTSPLLNTTASQTSSWMSSVPRSPVPSEWYPWRRFFYIETISGFPIHPHSSRKPSCLVIVNLFRVPRKLFSLESPGLLVLSPSFFILSSLIVPGRLSRNTR